MCCSMTLLAKDLRVGGAIVASPINMMNFKIDPSGAACHSILLCLLSVPEMPSWSKIPTLFLVLDSRPHGDSLSPMCVSRFVSYFGANKRGKLNMFSRSLVAYMVEQSLFVVRIFFPESVLHDLIPPLVFCLCR